VESSEFTTETAAQKKKGFGIEKGADTPHAIEAHFRAERVLPPATIDALSEMIRVAYKAANEGKIGKVKK
jgi:hypothetical protein